MSLLELNRKVPVMLVNCLRDSHVKKLRQHILVFTEMYRKNELIENLHLESYSCSKAEKADMQLKFIFSSQNNKIKEVNLQTTRGVCGGEAVKVHSSVLSL